MSVDVVKLAGFVPITAELLGDVVDYSAYIRRDAARLMTASLFGEDWSGPEQERQRLELGRVVSWDSYVWDDEDEEW